MAIAPTVRLVPSKIEPITVDGSNVVRERVVELFAPLRPVTLVSAMPGSGKSVAVRQWADRVDRPVAWVTVDSLDADPAVFWTHVLASIALACPDVDDEPLVLLRERSSDDLAFLVALIDQIHRLEEPPVLVLDGQLHRLTVGVVDLIARLVERSHPSLHVVAVAQVDPGLPVGRWRGNGWVTDVRGEDLRFTDDEAVDLARRIAVDEVDEQAVRALNRAVDGWAVALRLGLGAEQGITNGGAPSSDWLSNDRSASAQLGAQVMAMLDAGELEAALELSVFEQLDPAVCLEVVGDGARDAIRSLLRHDGLLTVVDHRTGTTQFHQLVRRLLELELGWRDPVRRRQLHAAAAASFEARGDVRSAYRHLDAVGEVERARALLVDAAVGHVDRGDLSTLHHLAAQLPSVGQVDRIEMALDLGLVAAWGEGTEAARRWCARAAELLDELPADTQRSGSVDLRLRQLRSMVALFDADLETAVAIIETLPRPSAGPTSELDMHTAVVAARALVAARHADASEWVARIESFDGPPIVDNVTIPALRAWQAWTEGDLGAAHRRSEACIDWLEEHHIDVHHWAIDSLITAGWCRLARGDLAGTADIAHRAGLVASSLPSVWNRAQAAYLDGTLALARGDAEGALRIATETRSVVPGSSAGYAGRLVYLAAEAAIVLRRLDLATELASELPDGPGRALLRARLQPASDAQLDAVLAGRASWAAMHRIRAEAILATRSPGGAASPELEDLVVRCGRDGWVHPFLNLGPRVERTLRSLPLDRLHPALLATLDAVAPAQTRSDDGAAPRLTAREQSLLELLPTHLSYAEMGERMYLSVNTIKASLKGLYRKLDAHTRAEAVAAGQHHGLI